MFVKSCTFIGHKDCSDIIEQELYRSVDYLITEKGVRNFYVGTQGNFDYLAYKVLVSLKNKYKIEIFVVLAYLNIERTYFNEKYTVFPEVLEVTPKRFAIAKRNKFMIDKSNYLICYVNNHFTNFKITVLRQ